MRVFFLIKIHQIAILTIAILVAAVFIPSSHASYTVENVNVTLTLNTNTSTQVTETLAVLISNQSVQQYETDRLALNLTLSDWQAQIGPSLQQHIINPTSGIYDFKFLPGPVTKQNGQNIALMIMTYNVSNVTVFNETAPRQFTYRFDPRVFNFEHGASGEVLSQNTTLTMIVPEGAQITSVYPLPDYPQYAFTTNYKNVTKVSWFYGEPLSKFSLQFVVKQSIQSEVESFFNTIYQKLGLFTYVLIAAIVILFIIYVYLRAAR